LWGFEASELHNDHVGYARRADWDPLETFAWRFSPGTYFEVYPKTAVALRTLEGYLGSDRMMAALGSYARQWRFKHPHAQDFFDAFSRATGEDLMWFFRPAFLGTDVLDYEVASLESVTRK